MISAVGVTKKFGDNIAVENLNLEVKSGEIFGFLGPNGAGKTTTISMLIGMLVPTSGRIEIDGIDVVYLDAFGRYDIWLQSGTFSLEQLQQNTKRAEPAGEYEESFVSGLTKTTS